MFLKLNQSRNRKKQNVSGEFLQKPKMHFFGGPKWYVLKVKFQICIFAYDQLPIFVSIFLFNHSTLTGQWKRETNLVYRCNVFMYFAQFTLSWPGMQILLVYVIYYVPTTSRLLIKLGPMFAHCSAVITLQLTSC